MILTFQYDGCSENVLMEIGGGQAGGGGVV